MISRSEVRASWAGMARAGFCPMNMTYGRVVRPWLGIYSLCVTPQVKERFNLSVNSGCYIVEVAPGSPAEKGGIKESDVIVKANDQDIKTTQDLKQVLKTKKVGEEITLVIMREDEYETITVKLAERPRE